MTNDPSKFEHEVVLVIAKFARGMTKADQEDLKQEARLALFLSDKPLNKKLAYDIARKQVIDMLRKNPPPADDIDDPAVLKKVERKRFYSPDEETRLDAKTAAHLLDRLPNPEQLILKCLFGIDNPEHTEEELAEIFGKTHQWVSLKKRRALQMLRDIMCI